MQRLAVVNYIFCVQRPRPDVRLVVAWLILEGLDASFCPDDLRRVVSAEESVGGVVHVAGGHAEGQDGFRDYSVFLQRPNVVVFAVHDAFLGSKSENAVSLLSEPVSFVKRHQLEEGALVGALELVGLLQKLLLLLHVVNVGVFV